MSIKLSPTLSIEQIRTNNLIDKSIQLNKNMFFSNTNNTFLPSFDFNTDIKFLTNSNAAYLYQSNSNPYELSKLSIDKYKNMKIKNTEEYPTKQIFEKKENQNKKSEIIDKENIEKKKKSDSKNKEIKYKKINNHTKISNINKNSISEIKKNEEELEMENYNNLKVSSILNETIGDNFYKENNKNNQSDDDLINYLKKENEELKKSKQINIQLINSLFYFINQLSEKYSPDKKVFDLSYYNSNINTLSSDLNNLNDFIQNNNNLAEMLGKEGAECTKRYQFVSDLSNGEKSHQDSKGKEKAKETSTQTNNYNNVLPKRERPQRSGVSEQDKNTKNSDKVNSNKKEEKIQKKEIKKKKENNRRKKNDIINLGRTFTFGKNDSFNNNINKGSSKKKQNDKNQLNKEKNKIQKITKNKNKNDIRLLGCNIKGNDSSIKHKSKINLSDQKFDCVPNEKDAIFSIKNIIYE